MNVLLIEPNFPIPVKSKNHSHFLPIGLLKIGSYHRSIGDHVKLVRGNVSKEAIGCKPDGIKITSLFTYWSKYVKESVVHYKSLYPTVPIEVGGIFASLMPKECKEITGCDVVSGGLYKNGTAENSEIDFSLLEDEIDYQIIHASRGCFRKCNFCGTWKIEPNVTYKKSIKDEIVKEKIVFYDNNILANPYIENILEELSTHKINNKHITSECQSGLDGRLLLLKPELASKLKNARFKNPRIAWDGPVKESKTIKKQITVLKKAGYKTNVKTTDMYIFMLYNFNTSYKDMCKKLEYCRRWGVLIIDCRYRPLNLLEDNYNPRKKVQNSNEYYIHKGWTDKQVRSFRRKVRRQNIAIRLGLPNNRYIEGVEKGYVKIEGR